MCVNLRYVSRLEDKFEDLNYEKNQLKIENEKLKKALEHMANALLLRTSCYLKKEKCEDDNCTECVINHFKNIDNK